MNDSYLVLKLTTGEQVMATLGSEDDLYVELHSPISIKTIPIIREDGMSERITAQPFNPYSEDKIYRIAKSNILYMKPLHKTFVSHYMRFVSEIEETVIVNKNANGSLTMDDSEELTLEEIRKRIEMLQSIVDAPSRDTEDEHRVFIQGNDTIN